MLYEGGGFSYTAGLPAGLHKKLHTRALSHPSPTYFSIGTENRYYVHFANGKSEWVGPKSMSETLHEQDRTVRSIAFGDSWDSYFVVFTDGWWTYHGVPESLDKKITAGRNLREAFGRGRGPRLNL